MNATSSGGVPSSIPVLAEGIRDVVDAFRYEIGRAPGLVELLEVMHYGARTLPDGALSDAHSDEIIGFLERPRASPRSIDAVNALNDAAFVEASDAFHRWWQAGSGAAITSAELGTALLAALRDAGSPLLGEPDVVRTESISPRLKRAKARASVGDIIAVPDGKGAYHLILLICRNTFGTAFGLLRGSYAMPTRAGGLNAAASGFALYSEEEAIASGRWRIVGHDDELLTRFPAEPERYHQPQPPFPGLPPIGAFGAAETADGRLRDIDEIEAARVDLMNTYQQFRAYESLERELPDLLARHGA